MNFVMLIILWFVFIVMYASMLFYAKPMNGQILGVTLSREHGNHSDVQVLLRRYRISCLMVLIVSVAISFLLLIGRLARYAEFLMLFLLILNLAGYAYTAQQNTKRLLEVKEKHGWVYPRKHIVAVDLNVTRQNGRAGVSPFFIYIFLPLSLIPTAFLFFKSEKQAI